LCVNLAASQPAFAYARLVRHILAMSRYRRANIEGGLFFFTVALADRSSDLLVHQIERFRDVYRMVQAKQSFVTNAICILPDHIHAIWTLPPGDADFASRWRKIKSGFSRGLPPGELRSTSQVQKREKGIWQRRFWEHAIRDDEDFERHVDYIHFNPVKHGYVKRVSAWPYSSFHRFVRNGLLPENWGGDLDEIEGRFGE
jgi:putative transposase